MELLCRILDLIAVSITLITALTEASVLRRKKEKNTHKKCHSKARRRVHTRRKEQEGR